MNLAFWLDIVALAVAAVLGIGVTFMVTGFGLRPKSTRYFALFIALQVGWAVNSILWRLSLGLETGSPALSGKLAALFLTLTGPVLLVFATRYLKRRRLWIDLSAGVGLGIILISAIPLFQNRLVYSLRLTDNGLAMFEPGTWGIVIGILSLFYSLATLVVFWQERRNLKELSLIVSISIFVVGYIFGGILRLPFPVLSIANALSVGTIAYGIFSRGLFNPLQQKIAELQHEIGERKRIEAALRQAQEAMEAALDVSHAELIVVDLETYRILFMNQLMIETYGDLVGELCYAALQGKEEVCPDCPHIKLLDEDCEPRGTYLSQGQNPDTGRWYVHVDQAIRWHDGRLAHMRIANDVSAQKQVEQELRENEARYRSLFEESPIALWEMDYSDVKRYIDGLRDSGVRDFKAYFDAHPEEVEHCVGLLKVLNLNQSTAEQIGVSSKEAILENPIINYHEDFFIEFRDEFAALAAGKTQVETEELRYTYTGTDRYRTVQLSIVSGYEDTWEKVIVSVVDITRAKLAEREMKLLGQIVQQMRDAVILTDAEEESIIRYVNDAFTDIYGYEKEEVLGRTSWMLFAGDEEAKQETRAKRRQAIKKMGEYRSEYQDRKKDGSLFWVSNTQNVVNIDGKLYDLGIVSDINERKKADEQLQLLGQITQQMKDAVILVDPVDNQIVFVNDAFCEIYGYERDEIIGKSSLILIAGHSEDYRNFGRARETALEKNAVVRIEYRDRKKNGLEMWVSNTFSVLYLGEERKRYDLGIIRDITAQKQAEEEILRLNRDLEQRVIERTAQLESFTYSVSHDLRAPLRAISGYSSLLLEDKDAELDEDCLRHLTAINQNAIRMDALIHDLLAFSRLGRHELCLQEVDTNSLVDATLCELEPEWEGRAIDFQIGDLPVCAADPGLLQQVFVNLLSNAIKFTHGREVARIKIRYSEEDKTFCICDNGVGFDMQYAHKLFNVFERLHSPDEYEGTGVGLAIVDQIVRRHGGSVWAEAVEDEGATFYFTLGEE